MKFDVTAVIKEIGQIETVGAKGFQKRNLILSEQSGQYENLVCVEFSGDKLATPDQFAVGQTVTVSGFINCREWNGKYFTSLRGSFVNAAQAGGADEYGQSYPPEGMPEPPAYGAPQPYTQPAPTPAAAPTYNEPQGFGQPAPAPAPAPQYNNTPQSYEQAPPAPSVPQYSSNNDVDTEIPF